MTNFRFKTAVTKRLVEVIVHNSNQASGDITTVSVGKEKYFYTGLTLIDLAQKPVVITYD